jgi:putative Mn2+ efflux pump MntP
MLAATARWERILALAPVIVVGVGLVAAVLILLGRAFADSVRDVQNKRLLAVGGVVLVALVVVLTYLGVNLPKE